MSRASATAGTFWPGTVPINAVRLVPDDHQGVAPGVNKSPGDIGNIASGRSGSGTTPSSWTTATPGFFPADLAGRSPRERMDLRRRCWRFVVSQLSTKGVGERTGWGSISCSESCASIKAAFRCSHGRATCASISFFRYPAPRTFHELKRPKSVLTLAPCDV